MNRDKSSSIIFDQKMCRCPLAQKTPRGQNVSIPTSPKIPQGAKCVNTPRLHTTLSNTNCLYKC